MCIFSLWKYILHKLRRAQNVSIRKWIFRSIAFQILPESVFPLELVVTNFSTTLGEDGADEGAARRSAGDPEPPAGEASNREWQCIFEKCIFENAFFENFYKFWRARSRLYQNEILQENMRSTAFFKLYKICIQNFAPLQSQNFRKKIALKN